MDESEVEALLDDLEASHEWRDDVPTVVHDLLARLPVSPATEVHRARLFTLSVDSLIRDRGAADAAVALLEVRDRAASSGHRALQARAELAMSRLLRKVGDVPAALEHGVSALALDGDDLDPVVRCRLRLAMADALAEAGSVEAARPRFRDALVHARSLSTPWSSLVALNNWAYAELLATDVQAAAVLVEELRAITEEHGIALNLLVAGTIAEVHHACGRSTEAIALLRQHLRDDRRRIPFDVAGCWLTLAQVEREVGDIDAAEESLRTAERLTTTHELHGLRVEAIGSRAELLAARGDHAGAYETHLRFHAETLQLSSAADEARAQTSHALLLGEEARRESARYREMSHHDPLTGLFNRRRVDEDLDARLARGDAVAVAMVDLDHFKRVNDTCSHEAGDAVLVRLAALLEATAAGTPDAYAARLGGEEFLLVLPGLDLTSAHAIAEHLRQTIAAHHWSDIAPGVPVTASIGLATTTAAAPLDRSALLRRADHHLYAAKEAGRNRVEG